MIEIVKKGRNKFCISRNGVILCLDNKPIKFPTEEIAVSYLNMILEGQ